MTNAEQREFAKYMLGRKDKRADLAQNIAQFTSADARAQAQEAGALQRTKLTTDASRYAADQSKEGYTGAEKLKTDRLNMQVSAAVSKQIDTALAGRAGQTKMPELGGRTYQQIQKADPKAAAKFRRSLIAAGVNDYITGFDATEAVDLGSM
jgi:hypothetical protein